MTLVSPGVLSIMDKQGKGYLIHRTLCYGTSDLMNWGIFFYGDDGFLDPFWLVGWECPLLLHYWWDWSALTPTGVTMYVERQGMRMYRLGWTG